MRCGESSNLDAVYPACSRRRGGGDAILQGIERSRRDGEEALEVGAFGEADGMVDGVAGAVDLSQGSARLRRRPIHRREEDRGAHPAGA